LHPLTHGSHRRAQGTELMLPPQKPLVALKRPYSEFLPGDINRLTVFTTTGHISIGKAEVLI